MRPRRPINADVPATEEGKAQAPAGEEAAATEGTAGPAEPDARSTPPEPPDGEPKTDELELPRRRREPKPLAPKLLAGLVVLALAFIAAAIVGGSGGGESATTTPGPAPATAPASGSPGGDAQTAESLGYPGFATDNTTRIGGSDPAADAAGAALAVFPSTRPAQRPAAVALADEEDWAGAIAAAVLMAPPLRAPLLYSSPNDLPAVTAEALDALDPRGSRETEGAAYFAIGPVALPGGAGRTTRVDSGDPAATAAQIATLRDRLLGGPPAHILVASSSQPDFAAPAAAWAARSGDPVLFAEAAALPQTTASVLKEHPKVPVYVLGPPAAISAGVVREIARIDHNVKRVAGKSPATSALALARYGDGAFGWNVNDPGHGFVLARSDSPLDAAAAAPLSASGTWGPLLLTEEAGKLPAALRGYFLDVKPGYTSDPTRAFYNHVWVIGDQDAIGVDQQAEVNQLAELAKIGGEG